MACRWQEEGPVMRNAFVIFHPGKEMNFLWVFRNAPPWAQASPLWGSMMNETGRGRRVGFDVEAIGPHRGWTDLKGLEMARASDAAALFKLPSWNPRMYCVVIWCSCWWAMKKSLLWARPMMQQLFHEGTIWCMWPDPEPVLEGSSVA